MLMQMNVTGMVLENDEQAFFLLLQENEGETIVSLQVDQSQAELIAAAMDKSFTRMPDSYDFLNDLMDSFELRISKVIIRNLSNTVRNADVYLTDGEREIRIKTRSADAVASALLMDAPIFMDREFLGTVHKEELKKWLSNVKPSDFGEI